MRSLLVLLALLPSLGHSLTPPVSEEARIKAARLRSNQAIESRNLATLASGWTEDFRIITSRSSTAFGREENVQGYETEFEHHADALYVRHPKSIEVFEAWNMAAEIGTWEGSWTEPDGKVEVGGSYYAKWHKVGEHWLTRVEIYSPGYCRGSEYCNRWP